MVPILLLFGLTAVWERDAGKALEVALGAASPFQLDKASGLGVALALLGILLVPSLTGALVAVVVDRQFNRQRISAEEAQEKALRKILEELGRGQDS